MQHSKLLKLLLIYQNCTKYLIILFQRSKKNKKNKKENYAYQLQGIYIFFSAFRDCTNLKNLRKVESFELLKYMNEIKVSFVLFTNCLSVQFKKK